MAPLKFYVDGRWCEGTTSRPVVNPFNGEVVAEVYQAPAAQVDEAITAAVAAFSRTRAMSAYERSSILASIAGGVCSAKERFARMITAETGKPISLSRAEVDRSIFTFTTAAEEAKRNEGSILPLDMGRGSEGRSALVRRFPLGPVAAITPFNFPLNLVAHKVGPAIASGCPVVLKPSSAAPATSLLLAEIIAGSPLPKGAFNVVPCLSNEADQLVTDERITLLSFTGSPAVGWSIKSRAGKKRVVLELGGNAGVIIAKDADLESAVRKVVLGGFANAGQSCISVQRIYIHSSLYSLALQRLVESASALSVGDPFDERTVVGPMINEAAAERVEQWITEAVQSGARVICGGTRSGALMKPTILTGVDPGSKVSCLEVFAPLVVVSEYTDFKDAIAAVNSSAFGLQAAVFTNSATDIFYAFENLEVGGVIVNDASSYRMDHMPYGGVKDSGFGREGVRYAIEEMTQLKLLALNFT